MPHPVDEPAPGHLAFTKASPTLTSRRSLLRATGLVALIGGGGAAFAGCSADQAPAPGSPGPATVATAEIPEGGGVIMPDADFVVTQPKKGSYRAFIKFCTHQGCPVAEIVGKEIVCRCHGSRFSIVDGSVVKGPAQRPLAESKITVSGDQIVVSG